VSILCKFKDWCLYFIWCLLHILLKEIQRENFTLHLALSLFLGPIVLDRQNPSGYLFFFKNYLHEQVIFMSETFFLFRNCRVEEYTIPFFCFFFLSIVVLSVNKFGLQKSVWDEKCNSGLYKGSSGSVQNHKTSAPNLYTSSVLRIYCWQLFLIWKIRICNKSNCIPPIIMFMNHQMLELVLFWSH
jgi:hypothetical protein